MPSPTALVPEIWHNPKCSKSRQALSLLEERGLSPKVRLYLKDPPDAATLDRVLKALGCEPREIMRRGEAPYQAHDVDNPKKTRDQLIRIMVENPILIERPIVLLGKQARLGRPPEKVLELLGAAR